MDRLLIFDFDGVIADSEVLANTVLAKLVSELGVPTTLQNSYDRYMGKRIHEVILAIEADLNQKLPNQFVEEFQSRTFARFRQELQFVSGAKKFIEEFAQVPKCIASSSSPDRLKLCLEILEIQKVFEPNVFSSSLVKNGKPDPDIFLYAAKEMGVDPVKSIVIEDSLSGVKAGIAAGMIVIGLTAASHIPQGFGLHLLSAGAHHIASSFDDATEISKSLLRCT